MNIAVWVKVLVKYYIYVCMYYMVYHNIAFQYSLHVLRHFWTLLKLLPNILTTQNFKSHSTFPKHFASSASTIWTSITLIRSLRCSTTAQSLLHVFPFVDVGNEVIQTTLTSFLFDLQWKRITIQVDAIASIVSMVRKSLSQIFKEFVYSW